MKASLRSVILLLAIFPITASASNSVVNLSHYDLLQPDFVRMKNEGVIGIIHEATFPRLNRDGRYAERQYAAINAGLLWGAYHFGDGTNPVSQADHFLAMVQSFRPPIRPNDAAEQRNGVLLVLDFEKNGHYPGGSMSVGQAVQFVERIRERTGKYPGIYGSENRLRQMLYGPGAGTAQRAVLSNCWLWIANYHAPPRSTAPWDRWHLWQYTGDGKCGLRPRGMYPVSVANMRKAERNIFNGSDSTLRAFWGEHAWFPGG